MIDTTPSVVAVIAVRNEENSLPHVLRHLIREGIPYAVLDNESTDGTLSILDTHEFRRMLIGLDTIPFTDSFDLTEQLTRKQRFIQMLDTDWVLHLDADEVMQSPVPGEGLRHAIDRMDKAGFNVINFDEFVFLPLQSDFDPEARGFQDILSYYFFEPAPVRLMRAWKKSTGLSNTDSGGHRLSGAELRIAPENMILRHYIFRSQEHAYSKYASRVFSRSEVQRGWHGNRVNQPQDRFRFPSAQELEWLPDAASVDFSRKHPRLKHFWQW